MLKKLFTAFLITVCIQAFGQMNMFDSTIQVVLHWDKGERQNYKVTNVRTKLNGVDTISNEQTTYDVELTVLDKTDSSYIIQWICNNIETNSNNLKIQKLVHASKVKEVIFKTNEFGVFLELVNWEEIKDHLKNVINTLREDSKDIPEWGIIARQIEEAYATKLTFQTSITKDVQQFLFFHGRKYKLGQIITEQLKIYNMFGADLLDSDLTILLEEINNEENNFSLQATQEANSEQLTNSTFNHLKTMAINMKIDPPKRKDVKDLRNDTFTSSKIYRSGWVNFSVQTAIVSSDNLSHVEKRIIEIK